jgi:hypothetical protein
MKKTVATAAVVVGLLALAETALAVPAFARRYSVDCNFCHDIYPKLTPMGQQFKENGFRMPNEPDFDAGKWIRTVPISVRASGTHYFLDGDDTTFGYFKGISAGNLGSRLAYWVDDAFLVQDSDTDDDFTHVKPDNAWARVEILRGGGLYVKGGRLELDIPFTQTRTPHLLPYEIYCANTGNESDSIAQHQDGVEIGGKFAGDAHWSAAVVERENSGNGVSDFGNVFLRLATRTNGNRFGAFGYFGKSQLGSGSQDFQNSYYRVGADADLHFSRLNLYSVYMYGHDDNSVATAGQPSGTNAGLSFHGGFVQGDYHLLDPLALTLRWNFVDRPPSGTDAPKRWEHSVVPGAQVWLVDYRLKLSFEWAFQNLDRSNFAAVQAEIAF